MADYHLIDGNNNGEEYRIVFHVSVPNEMNKANTINLRLAVKEDPVIKKPSIVPWVEASEQTKLNNGELIELVESFRPDPSKTLAENRGVADKRYLELKETVSSFLRHRYSFWRFDRDVPGG